jgi:wobble nucleotide-excising tRNase
MNPMLEKIVRIQSIGRFRAYAAKGDVTLRKLSLVYAENGRGKTTFCAILRSLQTGQCEFITERTTLAAELPAFVHLTLDNTAYRYVDNAWSGTCPDIAVFDPVFVNENVYSGDYVEHEHKKNLYRVIVGPQGVRLAKQIEDIDRQIRESNAALRARREALSQHVPSGITLEDYLRWQQVADIETEIQQKTEELTNRQRAAAKSSEIQAKGLLVKVTLPSLTPDFCRTLGKQLTNIVADAETKVRRQIAKHQMELQGESWLSQGLGYVTQDRCPFCGQTLALNELISAYRSHFNTAYRELKQEVANLTARINSTIGETALNSAQQVMAENAALVEFWRQFAVVELPSISISEIRENYAELREQCLAAR